MLSANAQRGFTIIELVVTAAIVAILAAIAIPSFNSFFVGNRAQTQTASFVEALGYARSEAVRRGQNVTLAADSGTDWHLGWTISAGGNTLRVHPEFSGDATLTSADNDVVFNSRGQLVGVAAGTTLSFIYCIVEARYDGEERNVVINHIGYVSVRREVCP